MTKADAQVALLRIQNDLANVMTFVDAMPGDAMASPGIGFIPKGDPSQAAKAFDPSRITPSEAVRKAELEKRDAEYNAAVEAEEKRLHG